MNEPAPLSDRSRGVTLGLAIVEVVRQNDIKDKFQAIGFEPTGLGVPEFSALHGGEIKRWTKFLTELGLRK